MVKTHITTISYFNRIADAIINFSCFILAFYIHEHVLVGVVTDITISSPFFYIQFLIVCILLANILGTKNNYYGYDRFYDSHVVVSKFLSTYIQTFAYTTLIFYSFLRYFPSRTLIVSYFLLTLFFTLLFRYAERKLLHRLHSKGQYLQNIVVVGAGEEATTVISEIKGNQQWGLNVTAVFSKASDDVNQFKYKDMHAGTVLELETYLKSHVVDLVIFAVHNADVINVHPYIFLCEKMGLMTMINLDQFEMKIAKTHVEFLGVIPMITFSTVSTRYGLIMFKNITDRVLAALALLVLFPFVIIPLMLLVRLTSKGPVFFVQERVGLNGRHFKMFKLRTMIEGAEDLVEGLRNQSDVDGPTFKMKDDPRITPVGRFLRSYSLDELPQLFNILMGDMSIVGPRPPIPHEVERYQNEFRRRLSMKPGLTCLWQISGRSDVDFRAWMDLDMKYIDTWSPIGDFIIILKTIPAVFRREGAY